MPDGGSADTCTFFLHFDSGSVGNCSFLHVHGLHIKGRKKETNKRQKERKMQLEERRLVIPMEIYIYPKLEEALGFKEE